MASLSNGIFSQNREGKMLQCARHNNFKYKIKYKIKSWSKQNYSIHLQSYIKENSLDYGVYQING